jgi:hypothetical protein
MSIPSETSALPFAEPYRDRGLDCLLDDHLVMIQILLKDGVTGLDFARYLYRTESTWMSSAS